MSKSHSLFTAVSVLVTCCSLLYGWGTDVVIRSVGGICRNLSLKYAGNSIYFAAFNSGSSGYIYKSSDSGETWTLFKSLTVRSNVQEAGNVALAATSSYLYAAYVSSSNRVIVKRWTLSGGSELTGYPPYDASHADYLCHVDYGGSYLHVVWSREMATQDKDIFYCKLTPTCDTVLSRKIAGSWPDGSDYLRPRIAYCPAALVVVGANFDADELYHWRSTDGGGSWSGREQHLPNGNYHPDISSSGSTATMVYSLLGQYKIRYKMTSNGGQSWYNLGGSELDGYLPWDPAVCQIGTSLGGIAFTRQFGSGKLCYARPSVQEVSDGYASTYRPGTATANDAAIWYNNGTVYFDAQSRTVSTITVISPNGGEYWMNGTSQTITWSSTGSIANVKIELSTNGGSTYPTVIASSTPNDGSYTWNPVSATPSTQCRIRISDASAASVNDASNANFTICNRVGVTAPNGGETWYVDSSRTVTWTTTGLSGATVYIELSTNGGSSWPYFLSSSTADDGSFSCTVLDHPTTQARVRVSHQGYANTNYDVSNNNFTIMRHIKVTDPNGGGANWVIGATKTVRWVASGLAGTNVKIDLSRDGGSTWTTTIASSTPDDGQQDWVVTGPQTTRARVRVTHLTYTSNKDSSDGNFVIWPTSGVEEGGERVLLQTRLLPSEPDPFRTQTRIQFELANAGVVAVHIYDGGGKRLWGTEQFLPAGRYSWLWSACDDRGRILPKGIYFCRFSAGDYSATRKLVKFE